MKYRAIVKQRDGWWIGWLLDLPGVNAQEKTRDELLKSLRIGAEDMLATRIAFESDAVIRLRSVHSPDPGSSALRSLSPFDVIQSGRTGVVFGSNQGLVLLDRCRGDE